MCITYWLGSILEVREKSTTPKTRNGASLDLLRYCSVLGNATECYRRRSEGLENVIIGATKPVNDPCAGVNDNLADFLSFF